MLASLASSGGQPRGGGPVGGGMRELDTEAPVIWPAWCYSAESGSNGTSEASRVRRRPSFSGPIPANLTSREGPNTALNITTVVKQERLSPSNNHDNRSTSRSRSVTPSTSSYPGTPPERGVSPAGAGVPLQGHTPVQHVAPARNYSDIMRSLAARYNSQPTTGSEFFHPSRSTNGFASVLNRPSCPKGSATLLSSIPSPLPPSVGVRTPPTSISLPDPVQLADKPISGLFAGFTESQGGLQRVPAFPLAVDMSSTKAILAIARATRSSRPVRHKRRHGHAQGDAPSTPLDLSAAGTDLAAKRTRLSPALSASSESSDNLHHNGNEACGGCEMSEWSVEDVCYFVESIDICAEYSPNFREQRIDGSGLPLLTEDHLTAMLHMKLGPALKLKSILSKKLSNCSQCQRCSSPMKIEQRVNGSSSSQCSQNSQFVKVEPTSSVNSPS